MTENRFDARRRTGCVRQALLAIMLGLAAGLAPASGADKAVSEIRCGWFDNPSPGNVSLIDRDGEWIIAQQGSHKAEGTWPRFSAAQWVRSGRGNYGYGCACLRVQADLESGEVSRIVSARPRLLAACRSDTALKNKEPGR